MASPTLGRLYPRYRYSFYRRLSGPHDQSGHPASNPGRPASSQAPCRSSYLTHHTFIKKTKIFYDACFQDLDKRSCGRFTECYRTPLVILSGLWRSELHPYAIDLKHMAHHFGRNDIKKSPERDRRDREEKNLEALL